MALQLECGVERYISYNKAYILSLPALQSAINTGKLLSTDFTASAHHLLFILWYILLFILLNFQWNFSGNQFEATFQVKGSLYSCLIMPRKCWHLSLDIPWYIPAISLSHAPPNSVYCMPREIVSILCNVRWHWTHKHTHTHMERVKTPPTRSASSRRQMFGLPPYSLYSISQLWARVLFPVWHLVAPSAAVCNSPAVIGPRGDLREIIVWHCEEFMTLKRWQLPHNMPQFVASQKGCL